MTPKPIPAPDPLAEAQTERIKAEAAVEATAQNLNHAVTAYALAHQRLGIALHALQVLEQATQPDPERDRA